jgi:hypothetical protein
MLKRTSNGQTAFKTRAGKLYRGKLDPGVTKVKNVSGTYLWCVISNMRRTD